MLKLIVGVKGTGKTKQLIEMVNQSLNTSNGNVVCIEKGDKLKFDVNYQCRLVNTDNYGINCAASLFGFVAGILSSNHDVTDLFVDSALKICNDDIKSFENFVLRIAEFVDNDNINIVMTSSVDPADVSDSIKKYI